MYIPTGLNLREMASEYNNHGARSLFHQVISYVIREAQDGKTECNVYTGGEHLTDQEIDKLRDLGWAIFWNSPCLWYEVSWN